MGAQGKVFYIVGAGISGLTLALALARSGARVTVVERNPAVSEFGAGLQISPNARKVLDRLGLANAVAGVSLEPKGLDLYPQGAQRPLQTLELGAAMRESFGAPYVVMHRADLAGVLHAATRDYDTIDIHFAVADWTAQTEADGVSVSWTDATGAEHTGHADALIGADGIYSATRTRLLGGPPAQYRGRIAWRVLLPFAALERWIALDRVSVLFGTHHHVVCYPLPHRGEVNVALFVQAPASLAEAGTDPKLSHGGDRRLGAILSAAGGKWTPWPLYGVETDSWHRGAVGLIGDAAHAMVPFQAQGAAMGIEDAAVLAPLLVSESRADTAFARYEQLRQDRVRRVANTSLSNGTIFHLPWPLSAARNAVIAAQGPRGHLRRLSWLYGYDPDATEHG